MNKPGKTSLFKASLLASLLAGAFTVQAAGLGKLTVYSAIGQPLSAEVVLTASAEELSSLSAKLGSHDAFKEAGIEFMPALAGLRFSVAKLPNNQAILKLTTDRPLNEPFLHFLLELNWTAGRMVREYTFLLDPPETLQTARPATVVAPVAPAPVLQSAPAPQQLAPQPAPVAVPAQPPVVKPQAALPAPSPASAKPRPAGEIQVKAGDTLSRIALENKSEAVSLDQMLVALFNSNRDVFDGHNMNRLRAGKILRLPDAAEVAQVDVGEARKLIVSQAADFNAYRRRLAAAADAQPAAPAVPQQQATGKIKAQVEEKTPPPPAKDKLEVSRTEAGKSAKAGANGKGSLEEDLIARDKALREAAGRIAELEKNLENLKQLVELKSQAGAQMQQQAQAVVPKPAEAKQTETATTKPAPATAAPAIEKPQEPAAAPPQAEPAKPAEPAPAPAAPPPPKPAAKKPAPPPPPEPSFIEDNPELVFGGGGLIALLLGYLGYSTWRRKKLVRDDTAAFSDEPSVSATELATKSGAVFGAASESVDSGEVSIQGDFSEGGVLTTEERVDPVAEADVYMAYGRDSQAEEILLEGLKTDPARSAIHLKLLELYANRKSLGQFEGVARKLHGLTAGQGSEWQVAVAMAAALGITGELFPDAEVTGGGLAPEALPLAAPAVATPETVNMSAAELAQEPEAVPPAEADGGSLDFDLDLGTTSGPAAAAAVEQVAEKPVAEEAMSLDFDFDLGSPEPAASPAPAGMPAAAEEFADAASSAADSNAIDFSLDIDTPAEAQTAVAEAAATDDGNAMEFDLDLGSVEDIDAVPATAVEEAGKTAAVEAAIDFSSDTSAVPVSELAPVGGLSDLKLDFDLELDAESIPASRQDAEPAALDLADISFDLGESAEPAPAAAEVSLDELALPAAEAAPLPAVLAAEPVVTGSDFDLVLDAGEVEPEVQAEAPPAEVQLPDAAAAELPDIDLSADFAAVAPVANEVEPLASLPDLDLDAAPAAGPESAPADLGSVPDDPEVATKLELAQAYEEMGDREGARELLNEVLAEGSPAQQALARTRLDQLSV